MLFVVSIYSRFVGFRKLGFLCTVFGLGFKLDGCLAGCKVLVFIYDQIKLELGFFLGF